MKSLILAALIIYSVQGFTVTQFLGRLADPCADGLYSRNKLFGSAANCNNGLREPTEQCDGVDFGGANCASYGAGAGTLTCTALCTVDTVTCAHAAPALCGNGALDANEECDGALLGGRTCGTLGLGTGTLTCSNCRIVTSGCTVRNDKAWHNCPQAGKPLVLPTSATTILLPNTAHPTLTTDQTVTIVGRNFGQLIAAPAAGATLARLCIGRRSQPNRYCYPTFGNDASTACDPTYSIVNIVGATPFNESQALVTIPLVAAPTSWNNLPTTEPARPLCIVNVASTAVFYSGLTAGTVAHCTSDANCGAANAPAASLAQLADLRGQTQCCTGAGAVWQTANAIVQTCINPKWQSCCGGTPYTNSQEKCCNTGLQTTQFIDSPCMCAADRDCNTTNSERCCLRTKYDALVGFAVSADRLTSGWGQCYDTRKDQCCNTGQRFDPGSQQCCAVSGLQNLEQPCPCGTDDHCADPTGSRTGLTCCTNPYPSTSPYARDRCDLFSQFPTAGTRGTSGAAQGCSGVCIDPTFQTCCYGSVCIREYEKCCNSTCCNRFVGSCKQARRAGAPGFPSNPLEYGDSNNNGAAYLYWQCSTVEHLDTVKGFLLFALPAILLASSLSGLGLALVFANKSSPRRYSFLERTLITFAVLSILLILPVFFSPLYKYAEVVVIASLIAIITAAVRVRWLNLFAIIVLAVTVIYIFDPFYGNALLTLAYNRQFPTFGTGTTPTDYFVPINDATSGTPDVETSGLLHATAQLHMEPISPLSRRACTTFYDYFVVDQSLLDLDRRDLKENVTFGYCSRAYVIALLFFEGFAAIFVLLQFVVSLLAIIVRFRKQKFDPIELEVMAVPVDE